MTPRSVRRQRGVTLAELLIVVCILGLITGMSALAVGRLRPPADPEPLATWRRARAAAIRSGRRVDVDGNDGNVIRFLPDGRAIGAGVDPLTGEASRATP